MEYIDGFLLYLLGEKGRSPNTIRSARYHLGILLTFLVDNKLKLDRASVTLFLSSLRIKNSSKNKYINTLILYQRYINDILDISLSFTKGLSLLSEEEVEFRSFTVDEINAILTYHSVGVSKYTEDTYNAIFATLAFSAGRISEVVSLKIKDIDFASRILHLYATKNNRYKHIPMMPLLEDVLTRYVKMYRMDAKEEDFLFYNRLGSRIKASDVEVSLSKRCRKIGIVKEGMVGCHRFRRALATILDQNGIEPTTIAEILGISLDILQKHYLQRVSEEKMRNALNIHPLSNVQPFLLSPFSCIVCGSESTSVGWRFIAGKRHCWKCYKKAKRQEKRNT